MDIQEYRKAEEQRNAALPDLSGGHPKGTYRMAHLATSAGCTRVMVYHPRTSEADRLPAYINLHGGGFVLGFPEVDDAYCRRIADQVQCVVVNVDYVLAPEHPFPAAVHECYDVALSVAAGVCVAGVDGSRIAIGGHSAGGNLAAAVCLLARQRRGPAFVLQILDYPVLDLVTRPRAKLKAGAASTELAELGECYNAWYLGSGDDARNPLASPLFARDLTGLPPALIITAGEDMLREEGEGYGMRLRAAGVSVTSRVYPGCGHGFTHVGPKAAAEEAWDLICAQLREAFHG